MIDGHIHYKRELGAGLLNRLIEERHLAGIALQCIPGDDGRPVEEDAFEFQVQSKVPVYVFGGIRRELYELSGEQLMYALTDEVHRLMNMGCTGIKMLEGKPTIRRKYPVPDFDSQVFEPYWMLLEEKGIPIYFHVNDPEEFWDAEKISDHAKECGWLYDETFINNEEQYRQVLEVLKRHPNLRILFPHFFFLSRQLERLGEILDAYPGVRIDITPGIELYFNLSDQREKAARFFRRYRKRILYGTDIGAREVVLHTGCLSLEDAGSKMKLIRDFLETDGQYPLEKDGAYVAEGPAVMYGLGLETDVLNDIYTDNFLQFAAGKRT